MDTERCDVAETPVGAGGLHLRVGYQWGDGLPAAHRAEFAWSAGPARLPSPHRAGRWLPLAAMDRPGTHDGLDATYAAYPFIAYGTDWLAFGHLIIALFFVGPMIDPVRNVFVLRAGWWACALGAAAGVDLRTDPGHPGVSGG